MNIKFAIKSLAGKEQREGEMIVRYTGESEPFYRISEREVLAVMEENGKDVLYFNIGLDEDRVDFFKWYTDEEKEQVKKQIRELKPIISKFYGGDKLLASNNRRFWGEDRRVSRLHIGNEDVNKFFDVSNPVHALIYLSVISGAFSDLIAPTRDWAERHQIPHYLLLETEDDVEENDEITRSDAHAALTALRKESNPEGLFILAWCLQYDTQAYGAYTKNIPVNDLVKYHIKYIDGKLSMKKKRDTPRHFIEYASKWEAQQTRPLLYAEAYIKAGSYFNFIQQKNKKFETSEGTTLGNTIEEAVETILKPKFAKDFQKLRDNVEAKWKE